MRVDGYWRKLVVKLGIENVPKPSEYEVYNGSVVFWFDDPVSIRMILKRLKDVGIAYTVEWDREEGLTGIVLKREVLH